VTDAINPHPPTRGKEKEEKVERLKLNIKSFTTNNNNIYNNRNNVKYTKPVLSFLELGAGILSAAARQHQAVPDWRWQ